MSEKIWFTSDLHFNHDKEFVVQARGFETVEEMNKAILEYAKRNRRFGGNSK